MKIEKLLNEVREIVIWDMEQQWSIGTLRKIIAPTEYEIKLLAKWRKNNQQAFHDDHPITLAGTKEWWQKYMLGNNRILFWVDDQRGNHIGHMGLAKFTKDSCELDNVVRGKKGQLGIMHFAVESLIWWAFSKLNIKHMSLVTRFDNKHAIKFYEQLDFWQDLKTFKQGSPFITMRYKGIWSKKII